MPHYAILIAQRAEAAFFDNTLEVAKAEIAGLPGIGLGETLCHGDMRFLQLEADPARLSDLTRLATGQGVFEIEEGLLRPLGRGADFLLHKDFVFGEKYRGKTNETLTQLLINLCLQERDETGEKLRLLDPMCGRGTSLLWGMRYGMDVTGIEQDASAMSECRRALKKWTKLHRQKHKLSDGWVQKANRHGVGKSLDFAAEGCRMRMITGDTRQARDLTLRKAFDMIVTDVPYGVQHAGGQSERSPLETLSQAAGAWAECLAPGGVLALAFNTYLPKRDTLLSVFEGAGLVTIDRQFPHRMSESILRDVLLMRKP